MQVTIDQFMAMATQGFPLRDPLIEKITGSHITRLIEVAAESSTREDRRKTILMYLVSGVVAFALLVIVGLSWLFLAYQKGEYAGQVIWITVGLVGAFLGGWGIGRRTKPPGPMR